MSAHRAESRAAAACAVGGAALLFLGTYLHPQDADPNDAVAAFTEYAADRLWIASHLMQLAGIVLMVAALLVLARRLGSASGTGWARIAAAGAVASVAVAAALQAVDGVALKRMVDVWAAATGPQKDAAFQATLAVRQVEIGLASMLSLVLGVTVALFGVALLADGGHPRWLGALAVLGGVPTALAGIAIAYTGFSDVAMALDMPAGSVLLLWMAALGVRMWRAS